MPIIKQLEEKSNKPSIHRILFLVTLIATGVLLDKIFFKKTQDIPGILGNTQEIKLPTQEKLVEEVQNNNFIKDSIKKVEEVGGVVMGEATNTVNKLASDAGSFVSEVVYSSSIGKVVEQIDKLPKDQQEKIREQICK
ncbi:MAG: hypothetical protein AAB859_02575 [Patescibacteria group bacterium]